MDILFKRWAQRHDSINSRFAYDPVVGTRKRIYSSYDAYLKHQSEKLKKVSDSVKHYDVEYERIVRDRYQLVAEWKGKSVLCLAARLGGEVRAFKSLGALAIGIDIEPGHLNPDVLHGDFHRIQFPETCFDAAFTNAIDHVYQLDKFLQEVRRVLKPDALFYVELAEVLPGNYEVLDTSDVNPIIAKICEYFILETRREIQNYTSYANWSGVLLSLRKN